MIRNEIQVGLFVSRVRPMNPLEANDVITGGNGGNGGGGGGDVATWQALRL